MGVGRISSGETYNKPTLLYEKDDFGNVVSDILSKTKVVIFLRTSNMTRISGQPAVEKKEHLKR